ncbi:hypothetical protein GGH13_004880 [Coemansia sp. S155-1]|nr:hypothetical protein GGH13_004880 [Coemansia sp. S155-1]
MTVEDEREKRIEAIERRLAGSSGCVQANDGVVEGESPAARSSKVISSKGAPKRSKFPGSGRTIAGETVDGDDEDDDEPEGEFEGDAGSDFDEEYLSEEDEDDGEDAYDSEEESTTRGGSSTYNLRAPSSKRKLGEGATDDSDDEDAGPTLRTRQKVAPRQSAAADEDEEDDQDEDGTGENDNEEEEEEEEDGEEEDDI